MAEPKPAALPLGDTPAPVALTIRTKPTWMGGGRASYAASPTPRLPEKLVERGAVEAPRHEAPPAIGHPPRQPLRLGGALERRENTRAGARQTRGSDAREPLERLGHPGRARADYRLAIVAPARPEQGE